MRTQELLGVIGAAAAGALLTALATGVELVWVLVAVLAVGAITLVAARQRDPEER